MDDELDTKWEDLMQRLDRMISKAGPSNAPTKEDSVNCTLTEDRTVKDKSDCVPQAVECDGGLLPGVDYSNRSLVEVQGCTLQNRGTELKALQDSGGPSHAGKEKTELEPCFLNPHVVVFEDEPSAEDLLVQVSPTYITQRCLRSGQHLLPRARIGHAAEVSLDSVSVHSGNSSDSSSESDSDPTWQPGIECLSSSSFTVCSSASGSSSDDSLVSELRTRRQSGGCAIEVLLTGATAGGHIRSRRRGTNYGAATITRQSSDTLKQSETESDSTPESDRTWHPHSESELSLTEVRRTRRDLEKRAARGATTVDAMTRREVKKKSRALVEDGGGGQAGSPEPTAEQLQSTMLKEKESFEVWSMPRTRKTTSRRENPVVAIRSKDNSARGKEKVAEGSLRSSKAKGMKRNSVSCEVPHDFVENDGQRPTNPTVPLTNARQGNDGSRSDVRGVDDFQIHEPTMTQKIGGKRPLVEAAEAEFNEDSDLGLPDPRSDEIGREKAGASIQKSGRHNKSREENGVLDGRQGEMRDKFSPERRMALKSVERRPNSIDSSESDSDRGRRHGGDTVLSYSSMSPDERTRKGKRPRHDRKRGKSYSSFEDEMHRRDRYMERRSSKRYGGEVDRRYGVEYGEPSSYGRRRRSRRSDSEDESRRLYSREDRRRHSSSEEDFRGPPSRRALALNSNAPSPHDENAKRKERRRKQRERETRRQQRESQGLKGHYIAVGEHGEPYGFGIGAWRQELNKLCGSLDPSVMDIRWQPEEAMKLLRRRLKDGFEYSAPISRGFIRTLAGRNVTSRRNKIINSMTDDAPCPAGMNNDIWRRLDRIRQNPRREELSQRMRYANSCRTTVGRTGPKGVSGVRDDLREKFGREPDPEEVEDELRRDKGYGGRSKKNRTVPEDKPSDSDSENQSGDNPEERGSSDEAPRQLLKGKGKSSDCDERAVTGDKQYIEALERRIKELTAEKNVVEVGGGSVCIDGVAPSTDFAGGMQQNEGELGSATRAVGRRSEDGVIAERIRRASDVACTPSPSKRKRKSGRR